MAETDRRAGKDNVPHVGKQPRSRRNDGLGERKEAILVKNDLKKAHGGKWLEENDFEKSSYSPPYSLLF